MKSPWCFVALLVELAIIAGCGKPDKVDRINSPNPDVFLTVETNYALGPAAADFTRIYAHLEAKGYSDKELVLDGQYLQNTKVVWLSSNTVMLCISKGYTESFRNYVGLRAGGVSEMIHTHFEEQCNAR